MTSRRRLESYTDDQANIVLSNCAAVLARGHLQEPRDIYPDVEIPSSVAYTRYSIPLPLLVLLYEKTTVYVPPLPAQDLKKRWDASLSTITDLARAKIVVPIIGRPTDYRASHFEPLLELMPPSLWARGVALLDRLNMSTALNETDCPLPIAEMARSKYLRRKYSHYESGLEGDALTKRITGELLLNYADLCIFGEHQLADSLASFRDPAQIVDRLHLANEVRTYPTLFGLGGTANYDKQTLKAESFVATTLPSRQPSAHTEVLPGNLDLLLKGIGINIGSLTAQQIVDFHASGDGRRLRAAMAYFEKQAMKSTNPASNIDELQQMLVAVAALESIVLDAAKELASPQFIHSASATERAAHRTGNIILRVGSPALGGWLSHLAGSSILDGITGGAVVQQIVASEVRDRIVDAALIARFRPGLANLWRIKKQRKAN